MAKQRGLRGFTRIDALVAGAACLVLVLLVPVLHAMTQEHYFRTVCAAHLAEIGKTMFVYAADNETVLPRAGGPSTTWGTVANWTAANRYEAFAIRDDGIGGKATISASFFLLVKYHQTPTGLFVCPSDRGTTEFSLEDIADLASVSTCVDLTDAWDFGPQGVAYKSCSFAYQVPYGHYGRLSTQDPGLAVAADRSPWIISPAGAASPANEFKPDISPYAGNADTARVGNSPSHLKDGQNVLFLDGRVTFETRAYFGSDQDNIYTLSREISTGSPWGPVPTVNNKTPTNRRDSVLLHDPNFFPDVPPRR